MLLASEDGVQPYDDEIPYCAAKAGVLALAKGLSRTYAREGLLVNAVSPAFIHTPMTDAMMNKRSKELGVSFDEAIESFLDQERPIWSSNGAASLRRWLPSSLSYVRTRLPSLTDRTTASTPDRWPLLRFDIGACGAESRWQRPHRGGWLRRRG